MRVTINKVNARIACLGYELVKGKGYFYFAPLADENILFDQSVYVYHLNDLSVDQWVETLQDKIEETNHE